MATAYELNGVSVLKAGKPILRDITLVGEASEHWVVLGPNGAGKTTLMSLLSTMSFPTRGQVSVLGELLGLVDVFELRPRIGFSSAILASQLPEDATVIEAVQTAAFGMTASWRETYEATDHARATRLLAEWQLAGFENRLVGTLSEGERKRTLIARALMSDPELLLLDEPAAGMDIAGREQLLQQLDALLSRSDSPATVLVTHHVEEIPSGITHALLLRAGEMVSSGPIAESLTSETLSRAFGLDLELESRITSRGRRWQARPR